MKTRMMNSLKNKLWILPGLALVGCAVGPDYQKPHLDVPVAYKEAATYADWKLAEPQDEQVHGPWWQSFGDAELDRLVEEARVANQDIIQAEARYRQAQALTRSAQAAFFPTISANASSNRSKRSASAAVVGSGRIIDNHAIGLSATWEADIWGRIRRQAESAGATEQATAADLESARLSVLATVAQSYFQLRILDTMQKLFDDTVTVFERSLQLTRNRYTAGMVARNDVVQSETQLKSTQSLAIENRMQRANLEHAIAVLLGRAPAGFSLAPNPYFSHDNTIASVFLPFIPPSLPSALLERRPDIAAAERRTAAANADIGVARAAFFPTFDITASGGYQSQRLADLITAPARVWAIGPALAADIFDGGLRRAQTDAAIANYEASVAEYRQSVLTGFHEVEDSLATLGYLREQSVVQHDAVRFARESVQQTLNRYKAGTVDYLSVVTVQATALANEREALAVEGRRLAASIDLVRALGGGWQYSETAQQTASKSE